MNTKELLSFLKFRDKFRLENINNTDFMAIKKWNKLNYSNESNEFRTIGNNEQDGSICPDCKGDGATYITQFIQPICKKCNGTGQI